MSKMYTIVLLDGTRIEAQKDEIQKSWGEWSQDKTGPVCLVIKQDVHGDRYIIPWERVNFIVEKSGKKQQEEQQEKTELPS